MRGRQKKTNDLYLGNYSSNPSLLLMRYLGISNGLVFENANAAQRKLAFPIHRS